MKTFRSLAIAQALLSGALVLGQATPPPVQPAVVDAPAIEPAPVPANPTEPVLPAAPAGNGAPAAPGAPGAPAAGGKPEMEAADGGYLIRDASINDIFQFLAKQGGKQYFHNTKIAGPDYRVTGHLNDGQPLQQMEEIAFMYGLKLYTKGNTVYALTEAQLNQLPGTEFSYQLKYLRPSDMDQIKALIQPTLTAGTGIVNYEPKTNTIVIIDSAHRIEQAKALLETIDKPKGQIVVETKILRINSSAGERTGVNWASTLGENGLPLEMVRSLNSVFGLRNAAMTTAATTTGTVLGSEETSSGNLVLSPLQINGVLHALAQGGFATQISNPTLITEDNEQATISIIDRVPIITTTVTQSNGNSNISEDVRYTIDAGDPTITSDPRNHREVGISMVVTPTLLPDGTVRMSLRPRSAQIVEQIKGQSGNIFPRVTESMVEALARVPDGHSLVVGGFYGETLNKNKNKVPILGDVPVINFFFKSRESSKEQTSLVFVVTPTSYNPANHAANGTTGKHIRQDLALPSNHDWIDDSNPGPAHEPNLRRAIRGLEPEQAPYYPTAEELKGQKPASTTTAPRRFSSAGRR